MTGNGGILIALLLVGGTTLTTFGQGTVNFANASTTPGLSSADRNVRFSSIASLYNPLLVSGANVSSNYAGLNLTGLRVQLYFTTTGLSFDLRTYTPALGGLSTFKQSTSATAGSWFNKTATLQGTTAGSGQVVYMTVVAWDSTLSSDPLSLAALNGLWGQSQVFQYTITANPTPMPSEFLMLNFNGFSFGQFPPPYLFPEPSAAALSMFGFATLFLVRRRQAGRGRRSASMP